MENLKIIDFHTHVFPDEIAPRALQALSEHSGPYKPCTDGTLSGLLSSMDRAGIRLSVVASIATKPTQLWPIFEFSRKIKSERIYPLVSFHPENSLEQVRQLLERAQQAGIKGVKLHPMYQGFSIDEERMYPYYELLLQRGFFVVFHTGYDIAFPGNLQASIERVASIASEFPELQIVTTHTGGWRQWERLELLTPFENIYTEVSMTIPETGRERFTELLMSFPEDRVFFGTDSPWTDQAEMIGKLLNLAIPEPLREAILYKNAIQFLKKF
jgi:predicted TIM-barrel fold metal-dependent hydrolase